MARSKSSAAVAVELSCQVLMFAIDQHLPDRRVVNGSRRASVPLHNSAHRRSIVGRRNQCNEVTHGIRLLETEDSAIGTNETCQAQQQMSPSAGIADLPKRLRYSGFDSLQTSGCLYWARVPVSDWMPRTTTH